MHPSLTPHASIPLKKNPSGIIQTNPPYVPVCEMEDLETKCASLRTEVAATEAQLARLKRELHDAEEAALKSRAQDASDANTEAKTRAKGKWPLSREEYRRYGRQMIVPQLGLQGMEAHHESSRAGFRGFPS